MKKTIAFLLLPLVAGCLTATVPTVSHWMIEYRGTKEPARVAKYGPTRLSQIMVSAPFNSTCLTVLRADDTVAFDAYNEFAAQPSQLMKGVLFKALAKSGLFSNVVGPTSAVATSVSIEAVVTKLALDCRQEGERRAVASVLLRILDRRQETVVIEGESVADAADGNYGKAFSAAVSSAIDSALGKIR